MSLFRTIRTLEGQSPRQGWAGHPSRLGRLLLLGWFALVPARGRIDDVTHWAIGDCCARFALLSPRRIRALLVVHQPIEQGPGDVAVGVEGDLPSPKAGIYAQHKRSGFLTARDRL